MTYQVNFHSFLTARQLDQPTLAKLQSPALQVALHEALISTFHNMFPELRDSVQDGMGRVEVSYLGL